MQTLQERLDVRDGQLGATLTALTWIARLAPRLFETQNKRIISGFLVKTLLLHNKVMRGRERKRHVDISLSSGTEGGGAQALSVG